MNKSGRSSSCIGRRAPGSLAPLRLRQVLESPTQTHDGERGVSEKGGDLSGTGAVGAERIDAADGDIEFPDQPPGAGHLPARAVGRNLSGDHAGAMAAAARSRRLSSAPPGR